MRNVAYNPLVHPVMLPVAVHWMGTTLALLSLWAALMDPRPDLSEPIRRQGWRYWWWW